MMAATESRMGKPRRAPRMPKKLPIEERPSMRLCQASAMRAELLIFFAVARTYQ